MLCLSNKAKPSVMYEGGVERARCTNLQNAAHCRRRRKATWGSTAPNSANWDRSFAASACFCAKNLAQKMGSPIGAPRISRLGTCDTFISGGKEDRSPCPNNSHLEKLMNSPIDGPIS